MRAHSIRVARKCHDGQDDCQIERAELIADQPHDKGMSKAARTLGMTRRTVERSRKVAPYPPRRGRKRSGGGENPTFWQFSGQELENNLLAKINTKSDTCGAILD